MRVAIIGGGITGLAAAWELKHDAKLTVFDPGPLGGGIRTTPFQGRQIDEGPDAFLTRVPDAVELCREVGVADELVAPSAGRAAIWWGERLCPLPEGLVLGVPSRLASVARSGVLSPVGMARAALDLAMPRRRRPVGLTVRQLVADRLGAEVADRLVDPLVGGIHAGWTGDLGAEETVPQLATAASQSRSLLLGLRRLPRAAPTTSMFLAPRDGLGRLVDVIVQLLDEAGVRFVREAVASVDSLGREVRLAPAAEHFDAVVVATSSRVASRLLGPDEMGPLAALPTASVALVTAEVKGAELPPDLSGFLVPRSTNRLITACSFGSNKWPHWAGEGTSIVRVSAGTYRDTSAMRLPDDELVDRLLDELQDALHQSLDVSAVRVSRWFDAFPQYLPGHTDRVASVEDRLRRVSPRVRLAGASYHGSGIPACISSGRNAARSLRELVTAPSDQ